jgi:ribose 5-phosphate isomerase B
MNISIGSDHAGFAYKEAIKLHLEKAGHQVTDCGTFTEASCDYPDYAHAVAASVEKGETEKGVLICGSANGVCITANKHAGIRAALCWENEIALLARAHNDANVVCLPARFISLESAMEITDIFMSTAFEGGRHANRVNKI